MSEMPGGSDSEPAKVAAPVMLPVEISLDAVTHYFSATAHRPIVRQIRLFNRAWQGSEPSFRISVRLVGALGQSVIEPFTFEIPSIECGLAETIPTMRIRADHGALAQIDEAQYGSLVVEVHAGDELIARQQEGVELLAYNQLMWTHHYFASMAAFVTPNHPQVGELLIAVRARLAATTGSGSTEGYQAGPLRVMQIMTAIWDEVTAQGFDYTDPPASMEGFGQKVRTADIVISERAATCLDSTVLFGSLLAAAGIDPVLVIWQGHAFVGAWMIGEQQRAGVVGPADVVTTNPNFVQDMITRGLIVPFETTLAFSNSVPISDAIEKSATLFEHSISAFLGLVDVGAAFQSGVRCVPSRTMVGGKIVVTIPQPTGTGAGPVAPPADPVPDDEERRRFDAGKIPARIQRWSDALLDLSRTNSLINLRSAAIQPGLARSVRGIDLPVPADALADLENRVMSGQSVTLMVTTKIAGLILEEADSERLKHLLTTRGVVALTEPLSVAAGIAQIARELQEEGAPLGIANEISARGVDQQLTGLSDKAMRSLLRAADDLEQQSASNQLHLCIGSLVWNEPAMPGRPSGGRLRSPLYIVPVRIKGSARTQFTMTLDEGAEITPNYCLLEKLRSELGLSIPELEKPVLDDAGIDVDHVISAIRQHLHAAGHTEVRVDASSSIAILDFASFRTWKDLRDNWPAFLKNDVVRHLVESPHESFEKVPTTVDEEILCPIPCDESQFDAVRWAAEGRSFVLEGPPGTGKSQTIANLIAAVMAMGKRVLFVAEKQVALEVVSRRLSSIGLDPFCIVIHHENITPDGIRQQLRRSLDFEGIDRAEEWRTSSLVLDAVQKRLLDYRDRLTEPNDIEHSLWRAQQEMERLGKPTRLTLPPTSISAIAPNGAEIESTLLQMPMLANGPRVNPADIWQICDRGDLGHDLLQSLSEILNGLDVNLKGAQGLESVLDELLVADADPGCITAILAALQVAADCGLGGIERVQRAGDQSWVRDVRSLLEKCRRFRSSYHEPLGFVTAQALNLDLTPQMTAASELLRANFLTRRKREAALAALLAPVTLRPEAEPAKVVALLQAVAQVRTEKASIDAEAASISGFELPSDWTHLSGDAFDGLEADLENLSALATVYLHPAAAVVRQRVDAGSEVSASDAVVLSAVLGAWGELLDAVGATVNSLRRWRGESTTLGALQRSLPLWVADSPAFLGLQRWVTMISRLDSLRTAGLESLVEEILSGQMALDGLHEEFVKARAAASRQERLAATGLGLFDRSSQDGLVEELVRADSEHKRLMRTVIPRQLVDRRPFRPRVRLGDIGKLEAELSRKVRRVSLPKLMRQYGQTVTRLTPCFLMSPDAVSRLLPAEEQLFDIVVFDEASQIKVANAIPAMGRGQSVIIVGDSKQMPPSQRIGTRSSDGTGEGEDGEPVVADLESILEECRESNLPSLMLKCHYRSRHEGLISFSNRYFYESELVTFPAPDSETVVPLVWRRVDGQFLRANAKGVANEDLRTNEVEADAIVAEVRARLNDPDRSTQTIGIVTFNEQQRWKILNKLAELGDPAVDAALQNPDPERRLFVSALEQVQGDERDVIMFSIAFSYQERATAQGVTRSVPLQFGPLVNRGGERRLNVAVTRAKDEMVVFCSFDPQDLDLSNSQSIGLELLKNFLLMARDASEGHQGALRTRRAEERDHHRRAILNALREAGVTVTEELGLSKFRIDLAVSSGVEAGQFLAILLDGPQWASRATAYDRDVLPEAVLRGIGWRRIGRVWLPAHLIEPSHVVTSVLAELERERRLVELSAALAADGFEVRVDTRLTSLALDLAVRRPGQRRWATAVRIIGTNLFRQSTPFIGEVPTEDQLLATEVRSAVTVRMEDIAADISHQIGVIREAVTRAELLMSAETPDASDNDDAEPGVAEDAEGRSRREDAVFHSAVAEIFVAAEGLRIIGDSSLLESHHSADVAIVKAAIEEILNIESPISAVRLATLLANRCGLKALRAARLEEILKTHLAGFTTTDHGFGAFVWKQSDQPLTWRGYRTSADGSERNLDHIAPEELVNAMCDIVEIGHSALEDELFRHTLKAFGRNKTTSRARERLSAVANWGIKNGRLHIGESAEGGRIFVSPS
jgi:hypothetical protein